MDVLKEPTKEPFWYQANINNEKWWSYFMKKNQDYPSKATESTKKSNFVASQGFQGMNTSYFPDFCMRLMDQQW